MRTHALLSFFLLLCFCFALSISAQSSSQHKQSTAKAVKSKQQKNAGDLPPSVTNVVFDKELVLAACSDVQAIDSTLIEIRTSSPGGDDLKYVYTVSAGKIIGDGATVIWDLTGAPPGTYTITAGIEFDAGAFGRQMWGRTITKPVKVLPCPSNQH